MTSSSDASRAGLRRVLEQLLETGRCPLSRLSGRSRQALEPLFDSGVLRQARQGAGQVVEAVNLEAVHRFLVSHFPAASSTAAGPPRALAVSGWRDAKRARQTDAQPLLFRACQPLEARRMDASVDLLASTRTAGAACLLLSDTWQWSLTGQLAVVENLECFLHWERLGVPAAAALYAGGRLSERCLVWLAGSTMDGCSYIHCGDYDPVGLADYLRLRDAVGERVRLHEPGDLEHLVATLGKAALLRDSARLLATLRTSEDPAVRRVVDIMDRTGCGLEQEALLLAAGGEESP